MRQAHVQWRDVSSRALTCESQCCCQRKVSPARMEHRVGGVADQEEESLTVGVGPRGHPIAEHMAVAGEAFESNGERRARSERVLDEVQCAGREKLRKVNADRVVACQGGRG